MKFAPLVLKHLRKNWIRTLSTVLAMSVCIFLFCVLQTVIAAVNFGLHAGSTRRLVVRDYVSLANNLPINYKQKIAAMPGVTDTTIVSWFGGIYRDPKNFFANLAVEPEAFLRIYPEIMLPPDQKAAWLSDVRGAIIGRKLAQRFGWKIGDHVQLESFIPPYRVGKPFDFVVDGIYDTDEARYPGTDLNSMYFNFKYLYEATGQRVGIGTLTVQIDDPVARGRNLARTSTQRSRTATIQTKTETEQAFRAGFVALAGNLALLLNVIGMAVAFTILLVTANTMSIAVRERQQEIAVLKTLGFSSGLVMTLILSEALLLGLMGGLLGILFARGIIAVLVNVPFLGDVLRGFPSLGLVAADRFAGRRHRVAAGIAGGIHPRAAGLSCAHHRSIEAGVRWRSLFATTFAICGQRWKVTLLAIFGIALVVAAVVVIASMSAGFQAALRSTGSDNNAIVTQRGSHVGADVVDQHRQRADHHDRSAHRARQRRHAAGLVRDRGDRQQTEEERQPADQHHAARRDARGLQGAQRHQAGRGTDVRARPVRGHRRQEDLRPREWAEHRRHLEGAAQGLQGGRACSPPMAARSKARCGATTTRWVRRWDATADASRSPCG